MNREDTYFFSVVVPSYNRADLLPRTLASVCEQQFMNYEVLIVDDGSTDNTEEAVREFLGEHIHYYYKDNAERAAARNYGTRHAKGKYICWFDSDDLMHPDHLQKAFEEIEKATNPEVFVQSYDCCDPEGNILSKHLIGEYETAELYKGNFLSCNAVFVRRDVALQNLFNEERALSVSEDYELWLRLAAGYPFHYGNQVTSSIIQHEQRSTASMKMAERLVLRFETFLKIIDGNKEVTKFLGRNYGYFKMKNYLILSVDLAYNGHKKAALKYLRKAVGSSFRFYKERSFYAIVKHLLIS